MAHQPFPDMPLRSPTRRIASPMTRSIVARSALAVATLTLAASALAQVYTWKDANGRVHYSDQPPPNVEIKPAKAAPGAKYAPANPDAAQSGAKAQPDSAAPATDAKAALTSQSGPKTWQEKDVENKQRRAAEQEADAKRKQEADRAAEQKRYCEGLRNNLTLLERGGRVTQTNAAGERIFMDDAQMKQEADRIRGQLSRDCK